MLYYSCKTSQNKVFHEISNPETNQSIPQYATYMTVLVKWSLVKAVAVVVVVVVVVVVGVVIVVIVVLVGCVGVIGYVVVPKEWQQIRQN